MKKSTFESESLFTKSGACRHSYCIYFFVLLFNFAYVSFHSNIFTHKTLPADNMTVEERIPNLKYISYILYIAK